MAGVLWNNKGKLPSPPQIGSRLEGWPGAWSQVGPDASAGTVLDIFLQAAHQKHLPQSPTEVLLESIKTLFEPWWTCGWRREEAHVSSRRFILSQYKKILVWTKTEVFCGLSINIKSWAFPAHQIHPLKDERYTSLSREQNNSGGTYSLRDSRQ